MRSVSRAALAIVLSLLGVFAPEGVAEAAFAPENDTIVSTQFPDAGGIATDPQGNSLVSWDQPTTALGPPYVPRARWLSAGGQLGPVIDLALGGTGFEPKVAMAPSGRAFVAWRIAGEGGPPVGAAGRWVEPDGSLGQLLTLVPPEFNVAELDVVVDPAGVATVGMRNQASGFGQELAMRRIQPDSSLGPLVPEVGTGVLDMEMAALPNGSTVGVWRDIGIEEAVLTSDLEVVPTSKISSSSSDFGPGIAVDSLGNGLVAWRRGNAPPFSVRGRLLGPTGAPLGEELIVEPDAPGNLGTPLNVSADSADDFLVAWSRQEGVNNNLAKARTVNSSGVFTGPVQTLSGAGAETPRAALTDRGTGAVAWGSFSGMSSKALGRTIDGTGAPTGAITELLGELGGGIVASSTPAIGFAAFAMQKRDGVVVRRYLDPPTCGDSQARVKQGKPIAVPLSCTGLAIETGNVVTPPKHGKLGAIDAAALSVKYTPKPGFKGDDSFTYTGDNDGGASNVAKVTIKIGKDTVKPKIQRFRFVKAKRRYKFVLKISERARVRITVVRLAREGKKRKRVVVGKAKAKKAKRKVTVRVHGKLARKLAKGGRFRATAIATDRAGNKSSPRRLKIKLPG